MNCPKCNGKMTLRKKDLSYNFDVKPKKKYRRYVYWCKKDDLWMTKEAPAG